MAEPAPVWRRPASVWRNPVARFKRRSFPRHWFFSSALFPETFFFSLGPTLRQIAARLRVSTTKELMYPGHLAGSDAQKLRCSHDHANDHSATFLVAFIEVTAPKGFVNSCGDLLAWYGLRLPSLAGGEYGLLSISLRFDPCSSWLAPWRAVPLKPPFEFE